MGTGFFAFRPRGSGGAEPVDAAIPGRSIVPVRGDGGTEAGMPGGGGPQVRYVAHFDADGNPSLGLLGPDGRTTADVDAPWTGRHPSEVLVAEMVTGPDGRVSANAIHGLVRNADGTYSGVRWDLNGGTVRYTTGLPGANHPLEGIVLRNVRRSDDGDPAAGARPPGTSYRPLHADAAEMRTPEVADTALRYSALQLDSDWGLIVRHVDPVTRDIHVVEVNEGDLLFFDPASRQTFGRSPAEGFPLRFEDGARVYHPGTDREYVYSAARGRFEPLRAPADAELYFNPGANATFLRHADGTLELFARGDNTAGHGKTWTPTAADDGDQSPVDWQFDRTTNRTYAPDDDGVLQPLDPEDLLTHYDSARNATYLVVPETGQVLFFGQGDNTNPNLAADPGRWQRARQWAATKIGDKRLGGAARVKLPGLPATSTGATEASAGRSLGTNTGVSKPHKSDRWWEFKNAPLAFLFGFSNQEALQFKASTFRTHLQSILGGKGDKSPFTAAVAGFKEAGAHDADPSKTVVELSIVLTVKTKDAQLGEGEVNFFGSRGDVYELPHGIPFNKVMSEIKAGLPLWARAWLAAKYGDAAPDLLLLLGLGLRPGAESRPELSIEGIPEGAKVPEVFMLQVHAALSQTRIQLQVVTDNPAALARAIKADPSLENLRPYFDAGPTLIFVDRGPRSGMRLSSVTGDPARLRITDLTGRDREVMNPSQMNLDVLFNKRRSMDYWLDRGALWPIKRTFGNSRAGQRWSQTRFGRRAQPQPHFTPGEGIYAQFRDANRPAQRRATLSVTPLSIFGLITGEIRAASKSPARPNDLPRVLGERDASFAVWLNFE